MDSWKASLGFRMPHAEEHRPYLPAFTDGILSDHLTKELAEGVAKKPAWTALIFPPVSVGASGSNEIG